jgi:dipeptidyl aminopeptidase/acylaminoacyl peptidase
MTHRRRAPDLLPRLALFAAALAALIVTPAARSGEAEAVALDQRILTEAKARSEVLTNLTYLCDEIGPRLSGSKNLKRANEWAAEKMRSYGLSNVHQEPWSLPEGWERGPAHARLLEPDTGVRLTVASSAWTPGTKGKVEGDVVIVNASTAKELEAFKGKLKGAIVLPRAPTKVLSLADIDKPLGRIGSGAAPGAPGKPFGRFGEEARAFMREMQGFFEREGVAAVFNDSGKPLGLLDMGGPLMTGTDRPSAANRVPRLFVAHNHYEMLYRLASRPAPARTRVEVEVQNTFVPGPIAVNNTVGEIIGGEKPDQVVVVGAHLDSWDLGQGATDNGSGSVVLLETARALAKSGMKPRRTIRFVLFTGEEQGLLGSKAYVEKHKDEMARVSACLVDDTGVGKITGIDARHRPVLQPILAKELASLKELGVTAFDGPFISGSDHASFDRVGVPGLMFRQEIAGYRLSHHSQADTLDRATEDGLVQAAQVMAVTALRIANLDELLPRDRAAPRDEAKPPAAGDRKEVVRFGVDDLGKIVGVTDPQLSPDGKTVAVVLSRPNYDKNRTESELALVDVATGKHRVVTRDRDGVGQPRWSPDGDRLAFLAKSGVGKEAKSQVFVMSMSGGDAQRITSAPAGVQHFAWKPGGGEIAYATADEAENKKEIERGNDAFEVGNDGYLTSAAPTATHVWLVSADGGTAKRLTSGPWSLEVSNPPGSPSSPLSWSPDGRSLALVVQEKPNFGDRDRRAVKVLDVTTGQVRALTGRALFESTPSFSPSGDEVAYWYPRDGDPMNVNEIWVAPTKGGPGVSLTTKLDRSLYCSSWSPDGKALLVGGRDGTRTSLWLCPLAGEPRRLDLGRADVSGGYGLDARFGRTGAIVFTASEPGRPTELYYMESAAAAPRRLTDLNAEVAGRALGKVETITWKTHDGYEADGVLTYPPDFSADKKYPLVLLIHGGPQSASVERFQPWSQLIAARGSVVFEPNYRGSDNRGNAYQRAIFKDQGDGPGKDVMAGLEALKKRGFVDEKRIAVTGWSYGGYMTTWLIGHYHVWKTAIAGAAVTDLEDQYNLSDGNVARRYAYGGSPWDGESENRLREQSPITYARHVKTPTLIVATTGDPRVTVTQSYKFYHALKDNGVPVKFVAYPVGGHFPADPVRQKDVYRRWVAWLDDHLATKP